jgi:hypothetical protein
MHVQRLVSVVKMATVFEMCFNEDRPSIVRYFCEQKDSMQRIFIKKCFLFTVGSVCRVKRLTTGSKKFSQGRSKDADDETEVRGSG